jgi:hypothetical protein
MVNKQYAMHTGLYNNDFLLKLFCLRRHRRRSDPSIEIGHLCKKLNITRLFNFYPKKTRVFNCKHFSIVSMTIFLEHSRHDTSRENLFCGAPKYAFCGAWVVLHRIFATKISFLWRTSTCATEIRNSVAH